MLSPPLPYFFLFDSVMELEFVIYSLSTTVEQHLILYLSHTRDTPELLPILPHGFSSPRNPSSNFYSLQYLGLHQ
ncbi:hypothetical protein L1887_28897 [Cichorium endivia]|nr:hypothetical protein L1887_28897 [Cichorium endivia]